MSAAAGPTELDLAKVDLAEIEGRSRAATPGPWESYVVGRDLEAGLNCITTGEARFLELLGGTVADQDFIAHAREDIPKLIAEIHRLRAALCGWPSVARMFVEDTPVAAQGAPIA